MARPGVFVHTQPSSLFPSYGGENLFFKVTTAANTVQRLGTLLTIPQITDETFTGPSAPLPKSTRAPNHLFIQLKSGAANPVYLTWDNVTAPIVGGPGCELQLGQVLPFYNAVGGFLTPKANGIYQVNNLTAIQLIAAAATDLLVWFSD